MEAFVRHKKDWFTNRVDKVLVVARTIKTPSRVVLPSVEIRIASKQHAEAVYLNHVDNKVNYYEKP